MKILNYKKKVKEIMEQYPEARDNDLTLSGLPCRMFQITDNLNGKLAYIPCYSQ